MRCLNKSVSQTPLFGKPEPHARVRDRAPLAATADPANLAPRRGRGNEQWPAIYWWIR